MSRIDHLITAARGVAERRVRHLAAARRLRFELAVGLLAADRPINLLDAGCGEGLFVELVAQRRPDWRIGGVDADESLLSRARATAENAGVQNVQFAGRDVTTDDLGDAAYEAVVALECLEEIEDDDAALQRMVQALRPGGLLIVHVPERDWRPLLRGSEPGWRHEVRQGYSAGELTEKLRHSSIDVQRVAPTCRSMVRLAQELRDRIKTSSLKVRALAYPPAVAAVRLERWGITWGPPTALLAVGRKP